MEQSSLEDPEVLLLVVVWFLILPTMRQIHFEVPFYTYSYPRPSLMRKQKLGITIEGNEYKSVPVLHKRIYRISVWWGRFKRLDVYCSSGT